MLPPHMSHRGDDMRRHIAYFVHRVTSPRPLRCSPVAAIIAYSLLFTLCCGHIVLASGSSTSILLTPATHQRSIPHNIAIVPACRRVRNLLMFSKTHTHTPTRIVCSIERPLSRGPHTRTLTIYIAIVRPRARLNTLYMLHITS